MAQDKAKAADGKAAPAADKAAKEPSDKQKAQQERMKACNDKAKAGDKKGDERKKFMSSCLKGEDDAASPKQKAQQDKMKSCNKEAGEKNMKGEVLHPGGSHHPSPHLQQPVAAPIVYNNNPVEKFQTIEEWKRQEKRIAELERELELLKITTDLKTTLNENKEPEKNVYLSFAENVLPSVLPIVDKFFALKEREIVLRENQPAPVPTIIRQKPKMVVPNPGEPGYNEYLELFDKMSDLECENELNRLQKIGHPAYNDLITRFYEGEN